MTTTLLAPARATASSAVVARVTVRPERSSAAAIPSLAGVPRRRTRVSATIPPMLLSPGLAGRGYNRPGRDHSGPVLDSPPLPFGSGTPVVTGAFPREGDPRLCAVTN